MTEAFCEEIFIQILKSQNGLKQISSEWRENSNRGLESPVHFSYPFLSLAHLFEHKFWRM